MVYNGRGRKGSGCVWKRGKGGHATRGDHGPRVGIESEWLRIDDVFQFKKKMWREER
jgi:hypothetical protein